jgi:ubiquitin C-terminal hydrolase
MITKGRSLRLIRFNLHSPTSALGKLYEDMSEPDNGVVYPSAFRNQFIKFQPKFRGYDQQDAQEFLRYLINGIHEEVNQAKYSTRPKHFKSRT